MGPVSRARHSPARRARARTTAHTGPVTIPLVVLVLAAPALLLVSAAVGLAAHGPLGWVAATALVVGVWVAARRSCRWCWAWWLTTKAPAQLHVPGRRPRDW